MWCKHIWVEKERFFGSIEDCVSIKHGNSEVLEALVGKTTILFRCENCGKPMTTEIKGKKLGK